MQNQFSPTILYRLLESFGIGESFAPADHTEFWWMMDKNNAKQALLARFDEYFLKPLQLVISDAADRQKGRTGLRRGYADERHTIAHPQTWEYCIHRAIGL
jgi:hypothetical protein